MEEQIKQQIDELNLDIRRNSEEYNCGSISFEEYQNLQNELIEKRDKLFQK